MDCHVKFMVCLGEGFDSVSVLSDVDVDEDCCEGYEEDSDDEVACHVVGGFVVEDCSHEV